MSTRTHVRSRRLEATFARAFSPSSRTHLERLLGRPTVSSRTDHAGGIHSTLPSGWTLGERPHRTSHPLCVVSSHSHGMSQDPQRVPEAQETAAEAAQRVGGPHRVRPPTPGPAPFYVCTQLRCTIYIYICVSDRAQASTPRRSYS